MSNVALASRLYGEGRIVVITDRIGAQWGGSGHNSDYFWRRLIEWNSKKNPGENIKSAIVLNDNTNYKSRIKNLRPIEFAQIDLQFISRGLLNRFDLLYFIGLPESISDESLNEITKFVNNGGGLLIENPNIVGNINVLSSIDSVNVESIQRPSLSSGYWTNAGIRSYFYDEQAKIRFFSKIPGSSFNNNWRLLVNNIPNNSFEEDGDQNIATDTSIYSEFGVSNFNKFVNGIVVLEEKTTESSSSSSSSEEQTSSSSSELNAVAWSLCDNLVANWNLDDNENNSIIRERNMNFSLNGELFSINGPLESQEASVDGKIKRSIDFTNDALYIKTFENILLNFVSNNSDNPFSIAFWFFPITNDPCVVFDKGGDWLVNYQNGSIGVTLFDEDDRTRMCISEYTIKLNQWNFVVIGYDGVDEKGIKTYVNDKDISMATYSDNNYSKQKNILSSFFMGNNVDLNAKSTLLLDEVSIYNKKINDFESEVLYNKGLGVENCEGIYILESTSSSSSSSSSSESNSESLDSSSSSSSSHSYSDSDILLQGENFNNPDYNGWYYEQGFLNGKPLYRNSSNIEIAYRLSRGIWRYYMYPKGMFPDIDNEVLFANTSEVQESVITWNDWTPYYIECGIGQIILGGDCVLGPSSVGPGTTTPHLVCEVGDVTIGDCILS